MAVVDPGPDQPNQQEASPSKKKRLALEQQKQWTSCFCSDLDG